MMLETSKYRNKCDIVFSNVSKNNNTTLKNKQLNNKIINKNVSENILLNVKLLYTSRCLRLRPKSSLDSLKYGKGLINHRKTLKANKVNIE